MSEIHYLIVLISLTLVASGIFAWYAFGFEEQPAQYYEGYKAGFSFAMTMAEKCCQSFNDTCINDPEVREIFEGVMDDR